MKKILIHFKSDKDFTKHKAPNQHISEMFEFKFIGVEQYLQIIEKR